MKPLWKATWHVRINVTQLVSGIKRYWWEVVEVKQMQRTYVDPDCFKIEMRQKGDSPTPQHCAGMLKRFMTLNGITKYRILRAKGQWLK
jgi:hypothetical protein